MLVEGRQEREFLMKELDKRGDKYRTIPVPEPFTVLVLLLLMLVLLLLQEE